MFLIILISKAVSKDYTVILKQMSFICGLLFNICRTHTLLYIRRIAEDSI